CSAAREPGFDRRWLALAARGAERPVFPFVAFPAITAVASISISRSSRTSREISVSVLARRCGPKYFFRTVLTFSRSAPLRREPRHLADIGDGRPRRGQATLDVLVHLTGLGDDVAAADGLAVLVAGHAARDEHDVAGADDVGEVADRLRHAGDADLLPVRLSH